MTNPKTVSVYFTETLRLRLFEEAQKRGISDGRLAAGLVDAALRAGLEPVYEARPAAPDRLAALKQRSPRLGRPRLIRWEELRAALGEPRVPVQWDALAQRLNQPREVVIGRVTQFLAEGAPLELVVADGQVTGCVFAPKLPKAVLDAQAHSA